MAPGQQIKQQASFPSHFETWNIDHRFGSELELWI